MIKVRHLDRTGSRLKCFNIYERFLPNKPTFKITTDVLNFESLKIRKLTQKEKLIYYTWEC